MTDTTTLEARAERDRYDDIMDGLRTPPVQDRARDIVRRILSAAEARIDLHGYDRITTADIAIDVDCSIGTVYRYFRDRVELLDAVAPDRYAGSPLATARALEQRDTVIDLLAQARWSLHGLSDRLDEHSYSELSAYLDDGLCDDDGRDLVTLRLEHLQAEEADRG